MSCEEVTMTVAHYHPSCVCETTFKWKHGGGDRIIVCTVSRFPCVSLYSLLSSPGTQRLDTATRYEQAPKRFRVDCWSVGLDILGSLDGFTLQSEAYLARHGVKLEGDRSAIINHGAWSGRCRTEQCSCQSSLTPTP